MNNENNNSIFKESKYGEVPTREISDSLYKLKSEVIQNDPRIGIGHRIVQVYEDGEIVEKAKFTPYKEYLTIALKFGSFKKNSTEHRWLVTRLSSIRFNIWRMEEEGIDLMNIIDEDIDDLHAILMSSLSLDKAGLEILTDKITKVQDIRSAEQTISKSKQLLYEDNTQ